MLCRKDDGGHEDLELGICMRKLHVPPGDSRLDITLGLTKTLSPLPSKNYDRVNLQCSLNKLYSNSHCLKKLEINKNIDNKENYKFMLREQKIMPNNCVDL